MKESLINKDLNLLIMPMDVIKLNFHTTIWNNPQQHTDGHPSATNRIRLLEKQLTAVPADRATQCKWRIKDIQTRGECYHSDNQWPEGSSTEWHW